MHFSLSTVLALGALHTFGVYAQDCINTCIENVKPTVGCADPADASCVCVSNDFVKGVAECARAPECAAADDAIANGISNGFCVGQQVPAFPGAAATTPVESAATSEAVVATTSEAPAAPETTAAETTPAAFSESSESPVTSEAVATLEAPEITPTDPAEPAESSATEEASASSTDANDSSATTETAGATATTDSEDEHEDETAGGGMSGGAKAGVGIGVTIGVLALLGVAGFLWKKRQNQQNLPRGNMDDMSPPMTARDRNYPAPDQGSIGEKHGYDLELMSHRYEDMLPREEPRHMV